MARLFSAGRPLLITALAYGRDRVLRAPFFTLARARVARLFFASRPLLIAALAFGRDRVLRAPFFTLARARVARLFFAGRPALGKPREPTRLRCGRDVFKVVRACLSIYLSLSRSLSLRSRFGSRQRGSVSLSGPLRGRVGRRCVDGPNTMLNGPVDKRIRGMQWPSAALASV